MTTNIVTTKQFDCKLIEFINFHYDKHYNIKDIDKIRFNSRRFIVYINDDVDDFYYVNYGDFSTFTY